MGHRQQDGRRRRPDDQHQVDLAHPRHRLPAALQQADRRDDVRQHPARRPARVERGRSGAGQGPAERARQPDPAGPGDESRRPRQAGADRREHGRRLGRHRRHLVERADGDAALSGQHPRPARPQLVERHRDRDADRPQGRGRRRQGPGDDHPRPPDQARDRQAGVGLLPHRPDQGREVHPVHQGRHAGADFSEHQHPLQVPGGDEEVLLRPEQVSDLSGSARHQYPTLRTAPATRQQQDQQ